MKKLIIITVALAIVAISFSRSMAIDMKTIPSRAMVLGALKGEEPFLLVELSPEIDSLQQIGKQGWREYLTKRAILITLQQSKANPSFKGKDKYTVRMVLVTEYDEYNNLRWDLAKEVALFSILLSGLAETTSEQVNTMTAKDAAKLVAKSSFSLDTLESSI